jgi:hypothetical protein
MKLVRYRMTRVEGKFWTADTHGAWNLIFSKRTRSVYGHVKQRTSFWRDRNEKSQKRACELRHVCLSAACWYSKTAESMFQIFDAGVLPKYVNIFHYRLRPYKNHGDHMNSCLRFYAHSERNSLNIYRNWNSYWKHWRENYNTCLMSNTRFPYVLLGITGVPDLVQRPTGPLDAHG